MSLLNKFSSSVLVHQSAKFPLSTSTLRLLITADKFSETETIKFDGFARVAHTAELNGFPEGGTKVGPTRHISGKFRIHDFPPPSGR